VASPFRWRFADRPPTEGHSMSRAGKAVVFAWLVTAIYYFYQYVARSAPGVMMPQLSAGLGLSTAAVASVVGLFYFGYSPFSLVAGVAMDRLGPRRVVPIGAALMGVGALLFSTGDATMASAGRFLQGAGGVFALVGAVYIATTYFPQSLAATLIGATQMFGMAGGSAGQFLVGPMIAGGLAWNRFWLGMGALGVLLAVILVFALPKHQPGATQSNWVSEALSALGLVFRNPQSILCGVIAGLFFIPTTILDMVWGVRYLQEAHGMDYSLAVLRSSSVPFGWIIGCPLLGFISDRIGRRKPVILVSAIVLLACLAWVLYGTPDVLPPYAAGLLMGIASGAAMLPYTVIKEANPSRVGGTATGVINFINFTFSALLGPLFAKLLMGAAGAGSSPTHVNYQSAFSPMLGGLVLAIVLTLLLKETGPAVRSVAAQETAR
jgi:MFS family permease